MSDDLHKQQVGLIGANGFIGSNILRALLHAGIQPRVLCGPGPQLSPICESTDLLTCDLTDTQQIQAWGTGLDIVIHTAGPPSVQASFNVPEEYIRIHTQGTAAVLHACQVSAVRRVLYISSAEVYGRPETIPVPESHRLQARSPYAAAKIGAEKLIEAYTESFGLSAVILRPFSIYGAHPAPGSLLATIIATAECGCVRVHDLEPIRDYCYVDDLAAAVLQAISLPLRGLEVFNIGTGIGTSVAALAKMVLEELNVHGRVLEETTFKRPGQSEIFELIADITKATAILGWRPAVNLAQGLRKVLCQRTTI